MILLQTKPSGGQVTIAPWVFPGGNGVVPADLVDTVEDKIKKGEIPNNLGKFRNNFSNILFAKAA